MEVYVDDIIQSDKTHLRIRAIEKLIRYLENKIHCEINDNSPEIQEQVKRLKTYALAHFKDFTDECIVIQKATVSTNFLLFTVLCRFELYMYEPSWRETSSHLQITDIAPHWVQDGFVKDPKEPLLFLSCAQSLRILQKIQQYWYKKQYDPTKLYTILKWIERRMSLLITFPFEKDTFDLEQYRQKHKDGYMANMALIWDCHAYFQSMYLDFDFFRSLDFLPDAPVYNEEPAQAFLINVINNIQGDTLCISYQKQYCEEQVRIGNRLIFKRRRSEVVAPTDMEIITEICGMEYSKIVHMNADVRLCDVLEKKEDQEAQNLLQLVSYHYYSEQKFSFPWQTVCVVSRHELCRSYKNTSAQHPLILHIPIINQFGVLTDKNKVTICKSFVQAILHWMHMVRTTCDSKINYKARNYFLSEWIDELLPPE